MFNKKIWLDLELREDIDDTLTLIYALENKHPIVAISITDPSISELRLVHYLLKKFDCSIPIYINGSITEYTIEKDINKIFLTMISNETLPETNLLSDAKIEDKTIVFCGGSLSTLNSLIKINPNISGWVQGGYASYVITENYMTLKKFKKRLSVPSWNLNLDLSATVDVLKSNIPLTFVSKNICHSSSISESDVKNNNSFFADVLLTYFSSSKYKDKLLHDVLAYLGLIHSDLIVFKPVNLKYEIDEKNNRAKWYSELNINSTTEISVDYDIDLFKKLLK